MIVVIGKATGSAEIYARNAAHIGMMDING